MSEEGGDRGGNGRDSGEDGRDRGDDRDPFGRLDESAAERDGDPFEELAGEDEVAGEESAPAADGVEEVDEPQVRPGAPSVEGAAGEGEAAAGDEDAERGDPFSSPESAFREVDVGDADEDDVWEALSAAQARGSVAEAGGHVYAEVSKHSYCETCRYFSEPPEVSCSNEGTEILEFVDVETVRVVDCPVVEERRALERGEDPG